MTCFFLDFWYNFKEVHMHLIVLEKWCQTGDDVAVSLSISSSFLVCFSHQNRDWIEIFNFNCYWMWSFSFKLFFLSSPSASGKEMFPPSPNGESYTDWIEVKTKEQGFWGYFSIPWIINLPLANRRQKLEKNTSGNFFFK